MGRKTRIIIWLIAGLAALFAIAAVAFLFLFDPNDFREDISGAVQEATGRELVIEGDVSLQVIPWLAVEVGRARLGNAPGFGDEPFAEFERAQLSVRLWPLVLRKEIQVGTAGIDGLRLNLIVDKQGRGNWDDLVAEEGGESQEGGESRDGGASASGALDISGIDINDAAIRYVNSENGDTYSLDDVNLKVGRISAQREPVPARGSLRFDVQPTDVRGTVDIDTVVAFDVASGLITFDGLALKGLVEGLSAMPSEFVFSTDGIQVQTDSAMVTMQPVEMSIAGIDARAEVEPFSYAVTVEPVAMVRVDAFSPRSVMTVFGVEPPVTADPVALSNVIFEARVAVGETQVALTKVVAKLDDTTFRGSLSVPMTTTGIYRFDLVGDALDLNRYMEPAAEGGAGAAGAGDTVPVEIPTDLIQPLMARGSMTIASVTLGALPLENAKFSLDAANGRLRIHPISAGLFGGSYSGDVRIDVAGATPVLSMNESVQGVDLAQLALAMFKQENITGSIAGDFKLSGRGKDMGAIQRTLGGTLSMELKDGTYEGTDVWYELRSARAKLKKETPPEPVLPARTKFSSVTATAVVKDGIMRNDDFVAVLPFMKLTGKGSVNIPDGTVDYGMTAQVFKKPEAMQGATEEEIADLTKTVIPLKITGPLASPTVRPDVQALLKKQVEDKLKDKLDDKLKDLFGN